MSEEETRSVVEGYLGDRGGHWLAEDVALLDLPGGESVRGRREAAQRLFGACPPATASLTVADGRAAVEWDGGPAVVFEVEAGEIVTARLYQGFARESATPLQELPYRKGPNREGGTDVE